MDIFEQLCDRSTSEIRVTIACRCSRQGRLRVIVRTFRRHGRDIRFTVAARKLVATSGRAVNFVIIQRHVDRPWHHRIAERVSTVTAQIARWFL